MADEISEFSSTEANIAKLIADTNKNFPLTRVNAKLALTPPSGTAFERVAGPGVAGGDVIFRLPSGKRYVREVKCITGGRNAFNRDVSQAVRQIEASGESGDVFIQVQRGYQVQKALETFRFYRRNYPDALEKYRGIRIQVRDEMGYILFDNTLGIVK